jgi:hypothetical protein
MKTIFEFIRLVLIMGYARPVVVHEEEPSF